MSENRTDGGPAFPRQAVFNPIGEKLNPAYEGMSLRDWFAGQWLASWGRGALSYENLASEAYRVADAMIAARVNPGSSPGTEDPLTTPSADAMMVAREALMGFDETIRAITDLGTQQTVIKNIAQAIDDARRNEREEWRKAINKFLVEFAAVSIPDSTLTLVAPADPKDAAQIGWGNCYQTMAAAIRARGDIE